LTPTKVHAVPLQLTSARLRSGPHTPTLPSSVVPTSVMSVCGVAAKTQERLPDLLSVCLQLFLYASNGIDSKMRTILYGRQLAMSWCTSRVHYSISAPVHFGAGFWFEPLPRLPPACFFALAGVIRSRGV
jgi:hypothetical protein